MRNIVSIRGSLPLLIVCAISSFLIMGCSGEKKKTEVKEKEVEKNVVQKNYKVPRGSENWPSFRGVQAAGLTANQKLPQKWDGKSGENIKWVVKTPGLGLSSPVVWGDKVFITTSVNTKDYSALKLGLYGDVDSVKNSEIHSWQLLCYEKDSGKLIWKKEAYSGIPKIKRHTKSSHANSTPAIDGKYVVAFFGSEGLYCYDFEGNLKWKRDLGTLDAGFYRMPEAQWEFGSSPVIHNGKIIVQCDVQKNSFLMALNIEDGKTVWKTDRDEVPTWSTPTIYKKGDVTHIVVNGYKHIGAYDFNTGKPIWWMKGGGDIPVPTPVIAFDHAYISSAHGRMSPIYSVNLISKGEIKPGEKGAGNENVTWYHARKGAYMPTPIVYGDYLYICKDNGILTCFHAKTGKKVYKERVGGVHRTFTASAVATDGKLYFADEKGTIHVVQGGPVYKYLASNDLGESCLATPAISGNTLFVRTTSHLFAIAEGKKGEGITPVSREFSNQKSGELVDLSKIKTDGSMKDPKEILKIAAAKLRSVKSVSYDVKVDSSGTMKARYGKKSVAVKQSGQLGGLPEFLLVKGKVFNGDKSSSFVGGSDGNEWFYVDDSKKTVTVDLEYGNLGAALGNIFGGIVFEFHSENPFKYIMDYKSTVGIKMVNGEKCYEVLIPIPERKQKLSWFFSVKDFIPRKYVASYDMPDGSKSGVVKVISNINILPEIDQKEFLTPKPEGYKIIKP